MTAPLIDVNELDAYYGDKHILKQVNLQVMPGEICVIMGGSGSGKSTLLRNILGLNKPQNGTVTIDDINIHNASAEALQSLRKKIGVAFQGGALLSSLTVGDNVRLPLEKTTDLDTNTIDIMMRLKLAMLNISHTENMMPSELSGGMLKRAGLARAIVSDPKILVFDEPSAGLDPTSAVELDQLIIQLRDALNMTIIVVTHELESAFSIADRAIVLFNGEIVARGTMEEIKQSEDERVQSLINRTAIQKVASRQDFLNNLIEGSD